MLIPSDPVHAFVDYPDVPVPHAAAGPLAGLTFAVKDIYDVAGYLTGCGNPREDRGGPAPAEACALRGERCSTPARASSARPIRPNSPSRSTGGTSTTARR